MKSSQTLWPRSVSSWRGLRSIPIWSQVVPPAALTGEEAGLGPRLLPPASALSGERPRRGRDRRGVDLRRRQQLGGGARRGQAPDRQLHHARRVLVLGESLEHGAAETALGVVGVDREQAGAG